MFIAIIVENDTADFQHWAPGYPKGGTDKNCAVLNTKGSATEPIGFWEDAACSESAAASSVKAICEKDR